MTGGFPDKVSGDLAGAAAGFTGCFSLFLSAFGGFSALGDLGGLGSLGAFSFLPWPERLLKINKTAMAAIPTPATPKISTLFINMFFILLDVAGLVDDRLPAISGVVLVV